MEEKMHDKSDVEGLQELPTALGGGPQCCEPSKLRQLCWQRAEFVVIQVQRLQLLHSSNL